MSRKTLLSILIAAVLIVIIFGVVAIGGFVVLRSIPT